MASSAAFHDPLAGPGRAHLQQALRQGAVVALPTETVPGLGVIAGGADARQRLSELKAAPDGRPYSLHLRDPAELHRLLPAPPPGLARWLAARLPGPLTVVVPREWVALPQEWEWPWPGVGLRLPSHRAWAELAAGFPGPLLMTSINPHGEQPLAGPELKEWLDARPGIPVGFDPLRVRVGEPSPVLAFEPLPRVLRGQVPAHEARPGQRVLVLCSGNICRSPLAAALLERELAAAWGIAPPDLQELGWVVASAGTFALPGGPASEYSVTAGGEIGLELASHRSQNLEDALTLPWDLVLGMSEAHVRALAGRAPAEMYDPTGADVLDPFGGDLATYRRMRQHLLQATEERVAAWSRWPEA